MRLQFAILSIYGRSVTATVRLTSMYTLLLCFLYPHNAHPLYTGQQLTIGFTQVDFNEEEGRGSVTVRVRKTGENTENLVVTVTPLTYDEFDSMGFTQPSEVPRQSDPAECKYLEEYSLEEGIPTNLYSVIVILQCCACLLPMLLLQLSV